MSEDKNNTLLGIRDIVIMNVIAILSLRQIPNVAPYGASAMLLWLLAAVCYSCRLRWSAVNSLPAGRKTAAFSFG